jgi:hypothetical protein
MRYLPLTADDRAAMLATIGAKSVDDFYGDVPAAARLKAPIAGLPNHQGELAVDGGRRLDHLDARRLAQSAGGVCIVLMEAAGEDDGGAPGHAAGHDGGLGAGS